MVEMVLQYTLYGLGIVVIVAAIGVGIASGLDLLGALRKMREVPAEGHVVSWYSCPPVLKSVGMLHLSPVFILVGISMFLSFTEIVWSIVRLVLLCIALILVGSSLFFVFRGRRLARGAGM